MRKKGTKIVPKQSNGASSQRFACSTGRQQHTDEAEEGEGVFEYAARSRAALPMCDVFLLVCPSY